MMYGVDATDQGWGDPGGFDPDDFGRRVRQLACDAHRILGCPDSPIDDVIRLHGRVWTLLREAPGPRLSGVHRWLMAARQLIADRLHRWAAEELESLVA
jgi:hypothetical protein